eukprot:COSAG02_NODE_112_length_35994_cov_12.152695_6_plen_95_part_00
MHQSGPNTSGKDDLQHDQPPRWAFLVAYDAAHNATRRLPHPALPDNNFVKSSGSSPVLEDDLVLQWGNLHLEAAKTHIVYSAAKRGMAKAPAKL